jgi:hypothetical protein
MNTTRRPPDQDPLFARLEVPGPPPKLRDRALGAGIDALQRDPASDVWERLWHSRPLRMAWSLSVVILAAAHLVIGPIGGAASRTPPITVASSGEALGAELEEIARLPRIDRAAVVDLSEIDLNNQTREGETS